MKLLKKQISQFQEEILSWYAKNKRDLPWRRTRDPYKILVSEIMLQQTQVSRVIPKYESWLKEFPTVQALASAQRSSALRAWSGLGYNRRALYLQKAAQALNELRIRNYELRERREDKSWYWPQDVHELQKLPGIGKYTAGAVACFAFNAQIAVVDTNIRKVILVKLQIPNHKPQEVSQKEIQEIADQLLPKGKACEWNQALMDYTSAMLKKEKIPIAKQSKFVGSNRYYRGKLLRLLIEQEKIKIDLLGKFLKEDFLDTDNQWLEKIVRGMEKDELVVIKKGSIELRNS